MFVNIPLKPLTLGLVSATILVHGRPIFNNPLGTLDRYVSNIDPYELRLPDINEPQAVKRRGLLDLDIPGLQVVDGVIPDLPIKARELLNLGVPGDDSLLGLDIIGLDKRQEKKPALRTGESGFGEDEDIDDPNRPQFVPIGDENSGKASTKESSIGDTGAGRNGIGSGGDSSSGAGIGGTAVGGAGSGGKMLSILASISFHVANFVTKGVAREALEQAVRSEAHLFQPILVLTVFAFKEPERAALLPAVL